VCSVYHVLKSRREGCWRTPGGAFGGKKRPLLRGGETTKPTLSVSRNQGGYQKVRVDGDHGRGRKRGEKLLALSVRRRGRALVEKARWGERCPRAGESS